MELSLPLVAGFAPAVFDNNGFLTISGSNAITISTPLKNEINGVISSNVGGPLTFSDTGGTSTLDGAISLTNSTFNVSGIYTTTAGLSMSNSNGITLTGTLTIDGGAYAELDNVILTNNGSGAGGAITGDGDLLVNGYFDWIVGTVSGGSMTVETTGELYLMGSGVLSRDLTVQGQAYWEKGSSNTFDSGVTLDIAVDALFDYDDGSEGSISTITNDGTLEIGYGDLLAAGMFTQTNKGTLQCDLDSSDLYGALNVTGTASLDGTLAGNGVNGYQPPTGTVFVVLACGSCSGQFATVDPQGWNAEYNPTSVDLISS